MSIQQQYRQKCTSGGRGVWLCCLLLFFCFCCCCYIGILRLFLGRKAFNYKLGSQPPSKFFWIHFCVPWWKKSIINYTCVCICRVYTKCHGWVNICGGFSIQYNSLKNIFRVKIIYHAYYILSLFRKWIFSKQYIIPCMS